MVEPAGINQSKEEAVEKLLYFAMPSYLLIKTHKSLSQDYLNPFLSVIILGQVKSIIKDPS